MSRLLITIAVVSVLAAAVAVLWAAGVFRSDGEDRGNVVELAQPAAGVQLPVEGPGLGRPAPPDLVARLDISIPPEGTGLPPGEGTSQDGIRTFGAVCASCHGPRGAGGMGGALTGGIGTLNTEAPVKTVNSFWPYATTLFDYIRRAMPLQAPQTLTDDEVYGLVAFLLSVDRIVEPGETVNAETLPLIRMPNRDGFVEAWPNPPAE